VQNEKDATKTINIIDAMQSYGWNDIISPISRKNLLQMIFPLDKNQRLENI
jgi:hypothetical protein